MSGPMAPPQNRTPQRLPQGQTRKPMGADRVPQSTDIPQRNSGAVRVAVARRLGLPPEAVVQRSGYTPPRAPRAQAPAPTQAPRAPAPAPAPKPIYAGPSPVPLPQRRPADLGLPLVPPPVGRAPMVTARGAQDLPSYMQIPPISLNAIPPVQGAPGSFRAAQDLPPPDMGTGQMYVPTDQAPRPTMGEQLMALLSRGYNAIPAQRFSPDAGWPDRQTASDPASAVIAQLLTPPARSLRGAQDIPDATPAAQGKPPGSDTFPPVNPKNTDRVTQTQAPDQGPKKVKTVQVGSQKADTPTLPSTAPAQAATLPSPEQSKAGVIKAVAAGNKAAAKEITPDPTLKGQGGYTPATESDVYYRPDPNAPKGKKGKDDTGKLPTPQEKTKDNSAYYYYRLGLDPAAGKQAANAAMQKLQALAVADPQSITKEQDRLLASSAKNPAFNKSITEEAIKARMAEYAKGNPASSNITPPAGASVAPTPEQQAAAQAAKQIDAQNKIAWEGNKLPTQGDINLGKQNPEAFKLQFPNYQPQVMTPDVEQENTPPDDSEEGDQ